MRFHELAPDDVRRFIAEQLELRNTISNAITVNGALRGYLRWRGSCGDAVRPLLGVISSPPHWSLASLPRALTPEQVDRVLNSLTGTLRSPKRGYAIVRLALNLGLRTAEINRLRLDDIDWQRGTVTLKRTKSKRQDVLPLLEAAGRALEDYIRHERPASHNRALFARHLAPHTISLWARMPSAAWCAVRSAAPASPMNVPTSCAIPWPVASWAVAARSRRWPTYCVTGR
ncbi:tyrosine-type recombinase/integrase [Variovorax rhizosphaerae]|uniref:Tyrosine-type recombinase/integrase n=1 Tax=Variovorax rhizosphaerae TaxID=1836200 RepID=A0ABU8X0H6_9BURK